MNVFGACGILAILMAGVAPERGLAANPSGALRIEVIAAPNFVVDSNVGTPASKSPRSAYLSAKIWNDGTTDLANVFAYIGNYGGGTNSTPGVYPSRKHPGLTGPLAGGQFALAHEGGSMGQGDAIRYMGVVKAGQSVTVYWLVSYPLLDAGRLPVFGSGPNPSDDLWLNYDIWVTAGTGASALRANQTSTATMRNEISASANKILPNTANQVPQAYQDLLAAYTPAWTNIAADGSVGSEIRIEGVWYQLGNVGAGYDADGDLVPDQDVWLQPVGDPALFDAGSFRLVKTDVLLVVGLIGGGEQAVIATDQLYFKNLPDNNSVVGFVRYQFVPLRAASSSQLTPYQEAASGSNNEKFNSDYGALLGTDLVSAPAPSAALTKRAGVDVVSPGEAIPYLITFTNNGAVSVGNPEQGVPLVIQDHVPAGTRYVAGSASVSNAPPAGMGDYTILYSTNNAAGWLTSEPVLADAVTDIQWWLTVTLPPGQTGTVRFSVQVDSPYRQAPLVVNTGGLSMGNTEPFATATASTRIRGNNQLGDQVYADNGSGGGMLGNQVQDGAEPGLFHVSVGLYYDANTNGTVDAGDLYIASTNSSASGGYLFTDLVDGAYLVAVNASDSDLPVGYTITTPSVYSLGLDAARTNANPVSVLTADFGFAPALTLIKSPTVAGPVYESRLVSYTLAVTNNLQGDGTGVGAPAQYMVWAGQVDAAHSGTGNSAWLSPGSALSAADGLCATGQLNNLDEDLNVHGFALGLHAGSITNVKIVASVYLAGGSYNAGDTFRLSLVNHANNAAITSVTYAVSSLTNGFVAADVTRSAAWNWADITTNKYCVEVLSHSTGGNKGIILLDAVGLQVTSDQTSGAGVGSTTLNPVPLTDTFDTRLLQFVSASETPASVATNGATGTLFWNNVGPLYPGGGKTVTVTFRGIEPPNNAAAVVTNSAAVTNAFFSNGRPSNQAYDQAVTNLLPTGVIGDFVWRDQNRDGLTNGESGMSNVKVVLTPPAGVDAGAGIGVSLTNTTDRNGYYLFTGLASTGRYVVAVLTSSLPNRGAGVTNTYTEMNGTNSPNSVTYVTDMIPTSSGGADKHLSADFGYFWDGATIDGRVWNDLNRSGTPAADAGENGLTNVTVYLYRVGSPSAPVATNRTDATGYFNFTGNYTGAYYVVVSTNTGPLSGGTTWTQTFDTDGTNSASSVAVVVVSGDSAHVDFSYYQTGPYAIGDTLYYDWNGDGVQNAGDEGIPNVPVLLYWDSNSNGVIDAGADVLMATAGTDLLGHYHFLDLPPASYLVVVDGASTNLPSLYTVTADPFAAKDGRSLVTITTANRLDQDFGYQPHGFGMIGDTVWRDLNADGVQSGPQETGITNVAVRLYADMNNDGTYVLLATTNTAASGQYLFANLPDGRYQVVVDTASPSLPKDAFNKAFVPTTATNQVVLLQGGASVLTADFGFASLGAIGDTIYFDNNASGSQDWNEGGISNVTVNLYRDVNGDGAYDGGDALFETRTTVANGSYLFTALPQGLYVVVVDTNNSPPLARTHLTAAPALDGQPLTNSALQSLYSQYGIEVQPGTAFMGADFGFQPPGVIGETVWIDGNGSGVREANEIGIADVGLVLSGGATVVTNRTDVDGYYSFSGLADGVYTVQALTNDVNFPVGLRATYDPDGTNTASRVNAIAITNGHIVAVNGVARADFDLSINFGYQYAGDNSLSGTVGLDGAPQDGVLGSGASGVAADEMAFPGQRVYLYIWNDVDGNGVVDSGETVQFGSTLTDANGDYQFTGLPNGIGPGTNRYLVSLSAPMEHLALTTTNGSTSALSVVPTTNSVGEVSSAYQVVAVAASTANIDFAFRDTWLYDFGDLPASYGTLQADGGAQNRVLPTPGLTLGATVTTETDGKPSAAASLDTGDDGVTTTGFWQEGSGGATLQVTVGTGSGWLVGYVDFNGNGNFLDAGELVYNDAVVTNGGSGSGVYTLPVSVPAGSISATNATALYARFRLLPEAPTVPELAFSGLADDGETEDYRWNFGAVSDTVWADLNLDGTRDAGEPPLVGVRVYVDLNSNGVWNAGEPDGVTDAGGHYGIGGFPAGSFVVAVDTNTLPAGAQATCDFDGAPLGRADVELAEGQADDAIDFGYIFPTTVSGVVRVDVNGNGVVNAGDTNGIAGVTVQLLDSGDNVLATTVTAADGGYVFTNVLPGTYTVREVDLAGYFSTTDRDGGSDNLIAVTVVNGTPNTGNDFYDTGYARVGDLVWDDLNGNGVQDVGEPGLTNVTVRLLSAASNVLATAVTDVSGTYLFTNLLPATYLIHVVAPTQYVFTVRDAAETNDLGDSDADAAGLTAPFDLLSGANDQSRDAGLYVGALIYGYVFQDLNTNLVRTTYVDYPVANMTVTLWRAGVQVASTVTAADGSGRYAFTRLEAGAYTVRFDGSTNLLEAVPLSGDAATDPERNRAAVDGDGYIAVSTTVAPGQGVLFPTEPINAGFVKPPRPLSESVAIRAYAAGDGVHVEFATANEAGDGMITVSVWRNGVWEVLGSVPAKGYGSNVYSFSAPGLEVGGHYYFRVEDEVGYLYDLFDVPVAAFAMRLEMMQRAGLRLRWHSLPGRTYEVYSSERLVGGTWTWLRTLTALEEETCLDIEDAPSSRTRFFKVVMQGEVAQ